jgi:hypothetical protein
MDIDQFLEYFNNMENHNDELFKITNRLNDEVIQIILDRKAI